MHVSVPVGATVEQMKAECLSSCVETSPPGYPAYSGPAEAIERLLGGGLATFPTHLQPYATLSAGEKFREVLDTVPVPPRSCAPPFTPPRWKETDSRSYPSWPTTRWPSTPRPR